MPRASARPPSPDGLCVLCRRPLRKGQRRFCSMGCVEKQGSAEVTPDEVAARAAAVRATWSDADEAKRRAIPARQWALPEVAVPTERYP